MSETAPLGEDAAADPLAKAYRREKRTFWWACGLLGLLLLAWSGGAVFSYFAQKKLFEVMAAPHADFEALESYINEIRPWINALRVVIIVLAIGFLGCLVGWLLAIRRRRKVEAEWFSQNL